MTMIAFSMFISLILLVFNSLDPRTKTRSDIYMSLMKLGIGVTLGFIIILLYGIGIPGLKYLFMFIGFGGIVHLFLTYKVPEVSNI